MRHRLGMLGMNKQGARQGCRLRHGLPWGMRAWPVG